MTERLLPSHLDVLSPLIAGYAYKPYRAHRLYSRTAQSAILGAEIEQALDIVPALSSIAREDTHVAVVVAQPLEWDSAFFGVPMARLNHVLAAEHTPDTVVAKALDATLTACLDADFPHVTARVDVADQRTLALLQARGFRLVDTLVTYTVPPKKRPAARVRTVGRIRDFRQDDAEAVVDIARAAYRGYRGRFQRDPHIPADRAEAFYEHWARACTTGQMADTFFVAESEGRLLGFLAGRLRQPASTIGGAPLVGGGLGACRPDSFGAYAGLIHAGVVWGYEHGGLAECQTQNHNFPVIRIYEAIGARYVRAEYTLQAWIGQ